MSEEKARWELHKDGADCFEKKIMKVVPYKTTAVWPLDSHLINPPSKISRTLWGSKNKLICDILLWTPTHGYTSVD